MKKLENFKKEETNLLSDVEMLNVNGGLAMATSRYTCWTETTGQNCCDTRVEKTRDFPDGTTETTTSEYDNNC